MNRKAVEHTLGAGRRTASTAKKAPATAALNPEATPAAAPAAINAYL